jgi:hypothetical protein
MKEEQKESVLKIHINTNSQNTFVALKGDELIEQLKRILNRQGSQQAIIFALSKGEQADSSEDGVQLILTEKTAHWDLMA